MPNRQSLLTFGTLAAFATMPGHDMEVRHACYGMSRYGYCLCMARCEVFSAGAPAQNTATCSCAQTLNDDLPRPLCCLPMPRRRRPTHRSRCRSRLSAPALGCGLDLATPCTGTHVHVSRHAGARTLQLPAAKPRWCDGIDSALRFKPMQPLTVDLRSINHIVAQCMLAQGSHPEPRCAAPASS